MTDGHAPHGDHDDGESAEGGCRWCPHCMLLGAGTPIRPEVADHVRAAVRELTIALRLALVAAEPSDTDEKRGGLRRIDLDE